jgi:DEAD/DEAH box helicase domain-containing protein
MSRRAVDSLGETVASIPPREANLVKLPDLHPELSEALHKMGASRLYSHQLEAYERLRAGENVVVATATASGKSLCYKIPAFRNALGRAKSRAVFLYPTKALAQDQLGKIKGFGLRGVHPATYDGDTPQALRADIRRRSNIVLTNPDMLNVGLLPNHEAWGDFLRNLEIVAVDEAHVLRGVFGSHVAAVLEKAQASRGAARGRPALRADERDHRQPAGARREPYRAAVLARGRRRGLLGPRRVVFRNPPLLDKEKGERRSLLTEGRSSSPTSSRGASGPWPSRRAGRRRSLSTGTRPSGSGSRGARRISPYRAGYTARERREIEGKLFSGDLLGVVSTNALELGVDVGALDAVVCCGYPGSVASIWQQWGRAGRGKDPSLAVYIAGRDSLDQFLFENPPRVLGRRVEAARVTMENPYILGPHLLAAAHEAPLDSEDEKYFGPAYRGVAKSMMDDRMLAASGERLIYARADSPARNVSLRSASSQTVLIADTDGELIGTAEATRAPSELHPGATYLHRGNAYEIEELDLRLHRAVARRVPNNFYTKPKVETDVEIVEEVETRDLPNGATLHWGRVRTTDSVTFYKKVRVADEKELGVYPLDLPDVTLGHAGLWVTLPPLRGGRGRASRASGGACTRGSTA